MKMTTRLNIRSGMYRCNLITVSILFLLYFVNEPSIAYSSSVDGVDTKEHISLEETLAMIFDIGSGIFAAFIIAISLIAYKNLKSKRLLLITSAFTLFFIRSILSRLDVFMPETLELLLAMVSFGGLIMFSLAILQMGKLWMKEKSTI